MEAVGNTTFKFKPLTLLYGALITFAMGVWAFGESAGRARAAAELSRMGMHEEAKALMLGKTDDR